MNEKNIPQNEIDSLARLLLPRILADYEREQGKADKQPEGTSKRGELVSS